MYLTKSLFEKNANNGLELHKTAQDAADSAAVDLRAGATSVRIFECREVEIESYTAVRIFQKEETDQ